MTAAQFESIFKQYYNSLCCRVLLIVNDKEIAEDLVQDAFIKFWETNPVLLNTKSAPSYIARIAINNALMFLRRKKYEEKQLEFKPDKQEFVHSADEALKENETELRLAKALAQLTPACRQIFVLSRYEEMSYKEIAEHLGISVKTVENQIGMALKILRSVLLSSLFLLVNYF
jgi:RNA polymerase sigma-70 factor, ECF subfamily